MGSSSYMNFKNFEDTTQPDGSDGKPNANYPLVRQSSVYSLTFGEFQNTLGGATSKDFGSINMEDLLKSIWSAEENIPGGNLQPQGSLTLPRTLSQKTVDEVWRDVLKETVGTKDGISFEGSNLPREPTLGEITLEEFLFRAGVVREDIQPSAMPNNTGIFNHLPPANGNNTSVNMGFQQSSQSCGVLGNQFAEHSNIVLNSPNLGINMNGVGSVLQPPQQSQPQLQPLFPKQATLTFSVPGNKTQMSSPGTKLPVFGITNSLNNSTVHGGAMVMGALRNGAGSPADHLRSDSNIKNSTDTQSRSPSPYNFGEGGRGRKAAGSLEKVVERRRKRMIKNRESAARSRARKQAYTLELEAEVEELRKLNQELRKKQEEFMTMQKNQKLERINKPWEEGKRRCLRRTVTGPW